MHSSASKFFFFLRETGQCVQDDLTPKTEEFDTLWHWLFKSFYPCHFFFGWRPSTLQSEATRGGAAAAGRNARLVPFFFSFAWPFDEKVAPGRREGGRTIVSCSCSEVGRSRKTEELGLWPWQNQPASLWLIRIWTDGRTEGHAAATPPTHHHLKTHYSLLFGLIH